MSKTIPNWFRNSGRPNPQTLRLSGAALRSMEAADAIARAAWDALERVEDEIAAHWSTPAEQVDAAWIAQALRLFAAQKAAAAPLGCDKGTVASRWRSFNPCAPLGAGPGEGWPSAPTKNFASPHTLEEIVKRKLELLRSAGVPMPDSDRLAPEYWDDASARGC